MRSLARGGRLVTNGSTSGRTAELHLPTLFWRQLEVIGATMNDHREFADAVGMVDRGGSIRAGRHEVRVPGLPGGARPARRRRPARQDRPRALTGRSRRFRRRDTATERRRDLLQKPAPIARIDASCHGSTRSANTSRRPSADWNPTPAAASFSHTIIRWSISADAEASSSQTTRYARLNRSSSVSTSVAPAASASAVPPAAARSRCPARTQGCSSGRR